MEEKERLYEAPFPENLLLDVYKRKPNLVTKYEENNILETMKDKLPERNNNCMLLYYRDGLTLEEIGDKYNVTRERIRQVLSKSKAILNSPAVEERLKLGEDYKKRSEDLAKAWETLTKSVTLINQFAAETANVENERKRYLEAMAAASDKLKAITAQNEVLKYEIAAFKMIIRKPAKLDDVDMTMEIREMDFSARAYNCLALAGVDCLADLIQLIEDGRLMKIRNLGAKSAEEILHKVKELTGVKYTTDGDIAKADEET